MNAFDDVLAALKARQIGADEGVANVQGITSVEHRRLERRAGRFEGAVVAKIRDAIAWMIELKNSSLPDQTS